MDNDSYTYKCPSCGSAIGFNQEKNVWICEYCKNEFNNLFLTPTEELEEVEEYGKYNYYYCDKCNTSFYSKSVTHKCFKCDNDVKGVKETIGGTISTNYSEKSAANVLLSELSNYQEFLPDVYLNNIFFEHKYIMCDLYSGSVVVTDGVDTLKYFFVNTIIPRIKTDNYRIYYDFANAGFNSIDNYVIDPKYNYVVEKESHDTVNEVDDVKRKIIETCKFSFMQTHSSKNEVTVTEDLSVKKNLLLRTYYSSFTVDGEEYRCYILGYNKQTMLNKYNRFSLDFPRIKDKTTDQIMKEIDELRNKINFLSSLGATSVVLLFVGFIFMLVVLAVVESLPLLMILLVIATPLVLVFLIFLAIYIFSNIGKLKKKISFYEMSIRANEKDFYYNLVNNSNFVKKVGR